LELRGSGVNCRRLQKEELHNLYILPNIIRVIKSRRIKWVGHVARMGKMINAYNILVRRLEGKRQLGRPGRRWEDNEAVNWMHLAQDSDQWRTLVNTVINLRVQ